jgi:N-methylhydantoinase B
MRVRIERAMAVLGTGGAGRFRGCGVYRHFEVEPEALLYLWFERSVTPARGLFGGREAIAPDVVVNPGRPDERHMLKVNAHRLAPGPIVELRTGGFGDPRERGPERMAADVRDGFVSAEAAERDYAVVVDAHGWRSTRV